LLADTVLLFDTYFLLILIFESAFVSTGSAMATMDAVLINKTGGTEVLEYKTDVPIPTLKGGEVLLKNEYIGVNFIDT
jgi:hypothetical protein